MPCRIAGQETTEFYTQLIDAHGALQADSADWSVSDSMWDTLSDNTSTWSNLALDAKVRKSFMSDGTKTITATVSFDDGWGNIYEHKRTETVTVTPYDSPIVTWTYSPDPFRINETFTVTPTMDDVRELSKFYGFVRDVNWYMDKSNNPTIIAFNGDQDDTFTHSYAVKKSYVIEADVFYWDGWKFISKQYQDTPRVANSPPTAQYTLKESGICVTKLYLTDVASDPDGLDDIVSRKFDLYKDNAGSFALINSEFIPNKGTYSYQFALEGLYKVVYTVTDTEGAVGIKETAYDILFKECGDGSGTGTASMTGKIQLQPGWQLIAIPTVHGYWDTVSGAIVKDTTVSTVKNYLLDQLAFKLGVTYDTLNQHVEVLNAYRGGQLSQNFVTGFTPDTSVNNFRLCYNDEESSDMEFTAFWIKVVSPTDPLPIIEWEYHFDSSATP